MYFRVSESDNQLTISLEEPDDCRRFHVEVPASVAINKVDALLKAQHLGEIEDETRAFLDQEGIKFLAAGEVSSDWDDRFCSMLAFASDRGWLREGRFIEAHIQRT